MTGQFITTKALGGMKAVSGAKGKKVGKVRRFVFHPSEKRLVGLLVKRPDAALMFHRKDLFVRLGGFDIEEGVVVVHDDPSATDKGAVKKLGIDWEACVIWVGMPVVTKSGEFLGYVDVVTFDRETGAVRSFSVECGTANNAILGKRVIPAEQIVGFKRGRGEALASTGIDAGDGSEQGASVAETGAILVSDDAARARIEGGAAAAAGKATAVATNAAKRGAAKAKSAVDGRVERAKPVAQQAARATGAAVEAGTFAVGKQLGKASGMFSAFKDEFDKASKGE